ncbi:hypothetical protein GF068_13550 [Polyangium spumosum]|uniref:Uncharacterized protein n=1 Tax=Polyangium spumosum TaxID=889282 RepID=A0A6N7PQ60_9BACT|nr:hypothetical protein [Polyangium spumosum]
MSEVFAARFLGKTEISDPDEDPTCIWTPGAGREGPRSTRDRIAELHELADRSSRASILPPPMPGIGEVSLSVREAIRGVDLFPAAPATSNDASRERAPSSSRPPRAFTFDRVLLAVAVGGSLVMGYKVGVERTARAGRSSLSAPELAGKVMAGAAERAHRIATSFRLSTILPPPPPEPVMALPAAKAAAMPAPKWQSHVPRTNRNAPTVATTKAPAAEVEEEAIPSVPPPAMSLVEAMAEAVKAKQP